MGWYSKLRSPETDDSNSSIQGSECYLKDPKRQISSATVATYSNPFASAVSPFPVTNLASTLPQQQYSIHMDGHIPNVSRSSSIWSTNSVFSKPSTSYYSSDQDYINGTERSRPKGNSLSWSDVPSSAWPPSDISCEVSENGGKGKGKTYSQRKPSNRDEFDGPHQLLETPSPNTFTPIERELPHLATNLFVNEQDQILSQVNDRLSKCAFDFVAKYQFPIPIEADKRPVRVPADREWTEWVYLLKRLATKRRIPARVLYNGQIKQLITILENSLEMRHAAKHQSRPLKDDRNVLQLISAGLQVAKILKDADAMEYLDQLYVKTEKMIQSRKNSPGHLE